MMNEFKYVPKEDPDDKYLVFDDASAVLLNTPPEPKPESYVRCRVCKHGCPKVLSQHLCEDFDKRVLPSDTRNAYSKNLYKIEGCSFSKEVVHCSMDKENEYRTINSTCEHAELDEKKDAISKELDRAFRPHTASVGMEIIVTESAKVSSIIGGNYGKIENP